MSPSTEKSAEYYLSNPHSKIECFSACLYVYAITKTTTLPSWILKKQEVAEGSHG